MHRYLTYMALSLFFSACHRQVAPPELPDQKPTEEQMVALNRDIVSHEATDIRLVLQRYGWKVQKTESGLFYEITESRDGQTLRPGERVQLKYRLTLLDGEPVSDSDSDGLMEVVVEKSDAPVGLHQLLRLMKRGEKARAVIPSHLAYGQIGDGDRIPGFASLVYYIEVQ